MSTKMIDVIEPATPHAQQHAAEIQPYGHLVRLPIALSETVCRDSVEHLNQLLADTVTPAARRRHTAILAVRRVVGMSARPAQQKAAP